MADNADRKARFPYDRDDGDEAAAHDPLMELSLIAGFDDTPREELGEAPSDDAPDAARAPAAEEPANSTQIDLEEALEAEPAQDSPALRADEPPADADEMPSTPQEPLEIPAFLSADNTGAAMPANDVGSAMEAELDLPPSAPPSAPSSSTWPPVADDRHPEPSTDEATEAITGDRPDEDVATVEPMALEPADDAVAVPGSDAEQPLDTVFGTTDEASEAVAAIREELVEPAPAVEPKGPVAAPSLEDELAAMLSGPGEAPSAGDPAPVHGYSEAASAGQDDAVPALDRMSDDPGPGEAGDEAFVPHDDPAPAAEALADDWSDIEAAWSAADAGASEARPSEPAPADADESAAADRQDSEGQTGDGPVFSRATPVAPDFEVPTPARTEAPPSFAGPDNEAIRSDFDIEDDFVAAFDEELAENAASDAGTDSVWSEPSPPAQNHVAAQAELPADGSIRTDPVDELAAIMGLERGPDPAEPFVTAGTEARSIEDMDAAFESALEQEFPEFDDAGRPAPVQTAAPASASAAPVLDTVDMSSFEGVAAADFDVPEFEPPSEATLDDGAFSGLEDELASALDEDTLDRPATEPMPDPVPADLFDDTAFDAAGFEAELARDIEFVGHDLDTARHADGHDDAHAGAAGAATGTQPGNPGRRAMIIGAVVAGLAVLGIGGVFALSGGDGAVDDGPVLVEADADPVKIEPDDPGGTTVPNQDRAVFASGSDAEPEQENLVSTAEEPVDIASAPADRLPSAVAAGGTKSEDRLTEGGTESTTREAVAPITPRRVRTLVVRPDGTLEERAPAPEPATNAETPAPAPASDGGPEADANVAAETAAPLVGEPETVAGLPVDDAPAVATASAPTPETEAAAQPAGSETGTVGNETDSAPVVVRRVQTTTATPAVIADRPADQPVNVVNRQSEVASASAAAPEPQPASTTPTPTVTNGSTGGFTVQLAALPSEAAARTTATRLSQQYGSLIAGRGMTIQRAVIDGRGTFYRIRVAADGSSDANSLCNRIKASGGNCFVAR